MSRKLSRVPELLNRFYSHRKVSSVATLAYTEFGKPSGNPPILIFHGLFGSKRNWTFISRKLIEKNDRHVFAVDLRNHGESEHTPEMSYELMTKDVVAFIEGLNLYKSPVLLGHSMGGKVVMNVALKHSHLISSLVVVDVSPSKANRRGSFEFQQLINIMKEIDLSKANANNITALRRNALNCIKPKIPDESLRGFLLSNLREKSDKSGYEFSFNVDAIESNLNEMYSSQNIDGKYEGSALFIAGSNSDYITKEDVPTINKLFPNNQLQCLKGAGHWLHYEKPNEFLDILKQFL